MRVRSRPAGSGLYKLTMTQLDPLEVSENKLSNVSITLPKRLPELVAYVPLGQQFGFNARIANTGYCA